MKRIAAILMAGTVGFLMILLGQVAAAPSALACSCLTTTAAESAAISDAVVVGTVVDSQPDTRVTGTAYTVEVAEAIVGTVPARVVVVTADDESACGFPMQSGSRYLLFTTSAGSPDRFGTNLCAGNVRDPAAGQVASLRAELGDAADGRVEPGQEGDAPDPTSDEVASDEPAADESAADRDSGTEREPSLAVVAIAGLLGGAAAGGAVALWSRRSRTG